ncbi:MAG: 6-phosphofructokinase [Clostridia bacterium]|nr:6-phosphofructokinase [Clostridia bacterium]MBO5206762.1 6-phosphofructokinase [Clostridia bacterium]
MKNFKRIGVLSSGGDAPGMNAAIRAVARTALSHGVEVMAIYRGYSGLIDGDIKPLEVRDVSNIINKGGTFLYSDRCPEFKTPEGMQKAVDTCHRFGIDGIVAIGGDGTFRGATELTAHGIPCVGIPATIDNDITSTDSTIGFDTAMNTVIELVDKLRDTCESHARCNVVEVMGRGAGDIALNTAIASGATAVIVPEFPHDDDSLCRKIKRARELGKRNFIIIVSEGVGSDYAPALAKKIQEETGVETKFARLAHIVRGGNPNLRDRVLASKMGVYAAEELLRGNSNLVVCERKGKLVSNEIRYALMLDKMYKKTLKDGDLDGFSEEDIARMKAEIAEKKAELLDLFTVENKINL